ncbi:MAG: site-specific integrase [Alphaproteobacteria bacterium]
MQNNKFKFTNPAIRDLPIPSKRTFYYDTIEPKLSLQVTPSGAKTFYIRQRVNGSDIRVKLGQPPVMKVEEARVAAVANRKMMNDGENPMIQSKKYKEESTLLDLYNDFMEDRERFLSKTTIKGYNGIWKNKISVLAKRRISEVTGDDLKRLHHKWSQNDGNYIANYCIKIIKAMFNFAIKEDKYNGRNPAISVKMNKTESRVRYMEHNEIEMFFKTLTEYDNEISRDAILMLIFTGARKRNVLEMNWNDIDLSAKVWKIPQTKTAKNQTLALVEPAIEVLQRRFATRVNEWVFYSANSKSGHLEDIKRAWQSVLKKANITNLRIHDLRHTLATYMIANGADAFMVKRALTHKSLQSTEVYVNLGIEHLRDKLNDTVDKMINIGKK